MQKEISWFSGKGPIEDWLSETNTLEGISPWVPNAISPEPNKQTDLMIEELDEAVDVLREFGGRDGNKSLQMDSILHDNPKDESM